MKYTADMLRQKEWQRREKNNVTNQMMTDYSHEERLCDLIVIENKTRRRHRRHIVKMSRTTKIRIRQQARPQTTAMTTMDHEIHEREARREREATMPVNVSRLRERGYTPHEWQNRRYDATARRRIVCY